MSTRVKVGIVTVVSGAVAFALTRVIWPLPSTMAPPPPNLLPLFILLDVLTALLFGIGVAFVIFGYPMLRRVRQPEALTAATYGAIAFLLLNWWPHLNMHMVSGLNYASLLWIDYLFHVPLFFSAAVVALFFARTVGASRTA
jgi:hypothetical protein